MELVARNVVRMVADKPGEDPKQVRLFILVVALVEPIVLSYLGVCHKFIHANVLVKVVCRCDLPHVAFEEV